MSPEYANALRSENNMLEDENLKLRKQLDDALNERNWARNLAALLEHEIAKCPNRDAHTIPEVRCG